MPIPAIELKVTDNDLPKAGGKQALREAVADRGRGGL